MEMRYDKNMALRASQGIRKNLVTQLQTVIKVFGLNSITTNSNTKKIVSDILRIDTSKPITGSVWESSIEFYLEFRSFFFSRKSIIFQEVGKEFFTYYQLWTDEEIVFD